MSAASATARADGVYLRYTVEVWLPGALGGCVAPSWIQMAIRMGAYGQWGAGSQAVLRAPLLPCAPMCVFRRRLKPGIVSVSCVYRLGPVSLNTRERRLHTRASGERESIRARRGEPAHAARLFQEMFLATFSASMALAAPALGRSALWHDRAVVRMSTASLAVADVQKSRYAADEDWIQRLDLPAFGAEVRALGRRLRDEEGAADLEHFRKIRRWTRACGAVGVATMGLPLNPLTVVALSTWTYASWTMVAHHTCHGGYDRHDAQPGQDRFHGSRFALGGVLNRGRDWLDWMLPEAWNLEHNVLHHYKLGEAGDPDLVERNLDFLRVATLPRVLKVAYVALMAGIWKCAPLCNSCASEHTICARFGVGSRLIAL